MKITLKKVVNALFDDMYSALSIKEINEIFDNECSELNSRWIGSNFTDFSIYDDPSYIKDLVFCWYSLSRGCANKFIKFAEENNIPKDIRILDDYNGIGLSTMHLIQAGFTNVFSYNTSSTQQFLSQMLYSKLGLPAPKFISSRENEKFDAVLSFEVAEHYYEPIEYVDEIINMINSNGYLAISTGFKNVAIGHFPSYNIGDEVCSIRSAGVKVGKHLRSRLTYLDKGWNQKPVIYKKDK